MNNFATDFAKSKKNFFDIVRPCFLKTFGGEFLQTEGIDHEVARALDIQAGIDALWIAKPNIVYTIALRVQETQCYKTFTVRKNRSTGATTEYEKIANAIKNETTYPHLTLQAYVKNDRVIGGAWTRTKSIYECIRIGIFSQIPNSQDGNIFLAVKWDSIQKLGHDISFFNDEPITH